MMGECYILYVIELLFGFICVMMVFFVDVYVEE